MMVKKSPERLGSDEWSVSGQDEGIAVEIGKFILADEDCMTRPELCFLQDEPDVVVIRLEGGFHQIGTMSHHDEDRACARLADRIDHPVEHRPSTDGMEDLGQITAHSRSLAGGEDDGCRLDCLVVLHDSYLGSGGIAPG